MFADADLERAAAAAPYAVFDNAGQDCCARSRILVERSAYDEFLDFSVPSPLTLSKDPKDTYDGSHYSRKANERVLAALLADREDAAIAWRGRDAATLTPVYRDRLADFMATTSRAEASPQRKGELAPNTD